jgi:hypothetical protein
MIKDGFFKTAELIIVAKGWHKILKCHREKSIHYVNAESFLGWKLCRGIGFDLAVKPFFLGKSFTSY